MANKYHKKPDPKVLGTGGAGQAGTAILGRPSSIDAALEAAQKPIKKRKKKKK